MGFMFYMFSYTSLQHHALGLQLAKEKSGHTSLTFVSDPLFPLTPHWTARAGLSLLSWKEGTSWRIWILKPRQPWLTVNSVFSLSVLAPNKLLIF